MITVLGAGGAIGGELAKLLAGQPSAPSSGRADNSALCATPRLRTRPGRTHLKNLRAVRARTGGAVILLDAGDMLQGTLESNLEEGAPVIRATRCKGSNLDVVLTRPNEPPLRDDEILAIATTDFLATGGDGFFAGVKLPFEIGPPLRDGLAEALRARGGTLDPGDRTLFDPLHPRLDLPGEVPIRRSP